MNEKKELELIKARIESMIKSLKRLGEAENDDDFRTLVDASMLPLEMLSGYIRFIEEELL